MQKNRIFFYCMIKFSSLQFVVTKACPIQATSRLAAVHTYDMQCCGRANYGTGQCPANCLKFLSNFDMWNVCGQAGMPLVSITCSVSSIAILLGGQLEVLGNNTPTGTVSTSTISTSTNFRAMGIELVVVEFLPDCYVVKLVLVEIDQYKFCIVRFFSKSQKSY